jgi:hypothetical protein
VRTACEQGRFNRIADHALWRHGTPQKPEPLILIVGSWVFRNALADSFSPEIPCYFPVIPCSTSLEPANIYASHYNERINHQIGREKKIKFPVPCGLTGKYGP